MTAEQIQNSIVDAVKAQLGGGSLKTRLYKPFYKYSLSAHKRAVAL